MAQRSSPHSTQPIDAEQVRALTVRHLTTVLPLNVTGYAYSDGDIYSLLVAAAAEQRSLESVSHQFVGAPSANLVRHYLDDRLLWMLPVDELEDRMNALLTSCLPPGLVGKRVRVAVDVTLLPYYGGYAEEPGEIRRGEAKAGTTRFHAYASVYAIRRGRRVSLAVAFVQAEDALVDVLAELLARVQVLRIGIERLYLDRDFASVAVLRLLAEQPFTSVVALPKRGQRFKALLTGRQGTRTSYTLSSAEEGELTVPVWISVRYAKGRRGKQGREYLPFAVVGRAHCELTIRQVAGEYRERFGIESSYRLMHQGLARTTSRDPGLRLLLVTVGLVLTNLWVWLKAILLAHTRRGERVDARAWLEHTFRLDGFRDLLLEAIRARFQARTDLRYPFQLTASFTLQEAQIGKY